MKTRLIPVSRSYCSDNCLQSWILRCCSCDFIKLHRLWCGSSGSLINKLFCYPLLSAGCNRVFLGMTGHEVSRVVRPLLVDDVNLVRLHSENPSFNSCRWFGLWVIEDSNQVLVVSNHYCRFSVDIEMKVLTSPDDCKCFSLCLAVSTFYFCQRSARIRNDFPMTCSRICLCQYCSKANWAGVDVDRRLSVRAKVGRNRCVT